MTSHTTEQFRNALKRLPQHVNRHARQAYSLFQRDPFHPSLRFKQIHPTRPIYSVRIGLSYRAVGTREGEVMIWFWIGPHDEYAKLISRL